MTNRPRSITFAEQVEITQMTNVLQRCLQEAVKSEDPITVLHETLQTLDDNGIFPGFDWGTIEGALDEVLQNREVLETVAYKTALKTTGLSTQQRSLAVSAAHRSSPSHHSGLLRG